MGGRPGGWLVPNNDIGYLICNRRQYRLATPHFIPPLPPSLLLLHRPPSRSSLLVPFSAPFSIPVPIHYTRALASTFVRYAYTTTHAQRGTHTHTRAHTEAHRANGYRYERTLSRNTSDRPVRLSSRAFSPTFPRSTYQQADRQCQMLARPISLAIRSLLAGPYSLSSRTRRREEKRREEKRGTESESRDDEETR